MSDRDWLRRSLKEATENVGQWPAWKRSLEDAKRGSAGEAGVTGVSNNLGVTKDPKVEKH